MLENRRRLRKLTASRICLTAITLVVVTIMVSCGGRKSEPSGRSTVHVPGDLSASDSVRDKKECDEIYGPGAGPPLTILTIGEIICIREDDNEFTVQQGGCLLKKDSDSFHVVSCEDAPAEGCLEGAVNGNTVIYKRPCQYR